MNEFIRLFSLLIRINLTKKAGNKEISEINIGVLIALKIGILTFFSELNTRYETKKETAYDALVLIGAPSAPKLSELMSIKPRAHLNTAPIIKEVTADFILPVPSSTVFIIINKE